jgi:hypothetical protein
MNTIKACPRGHRYRAVLYPEGFTTCRRCDVADLVALAYGDSQNPPRSCRLLEFRTDLIQDFDEFTELVWVIGSYNRFRAAVVLRELAPIFPKLFGVEIGREASPVIYARPPLWTHQAIEWSGLGMGVPIPLEQRKALGESFLKAMRRAQADELSDEGGVYRAWWEGEPNDQ